MLVYGRSGCRCVDVDRRGGPRARELRNVVVTGEF